MVKLWKVIFALGAGAVTFYFTDQNYNNAKYTWKIRRQIENFFDKAQTETKNLLSKLPLKFVPEEGFRSYKPTEEYTEKKYVEEQRRDSQYKTNEIEKDDLEKLSEETDKMARDLADTAVEMTKEAEKMPYTGLRPFKLGEKMKKEFDSMFEKRKK